MAKRPAYTVGEYELGRLAEPSVEFPWGQFCAVWYEGPKRRRFRLEVGLDQPQTDAEAALNLFARKREAIAIADTRCTVGDLFRAYLKDRTREKKSVDVMHHNWRALEPTFGHLQPPDLEKIVIVEGEESTLCHQYALERSNAGIARATIWTELSRLRTAMNWAVKRKHIKEAPFVWVPSKGGGRDPQLDEVDVWKIFDACKSPHIKLATLLTMSTSARKEAVEELLWTRVDFERRLVDFRTAEERSILDSSHKKSRAVVPMNNLLFLALQEAKKYARTEYVIEWNGQSAGDIKKAIQRVVVRAGLGGRYIGLHALRHAAATWLAEGDIDMRHVQRFLGHEKLDTTETVYAKPTAAKLTNAAEVIELRLRRPQTG